MRKTIEVLASYTAGDYTIYTGPEADAGGPPGPDPGPEDREILFRLPAPVPIDRQHAWGFTAPSTGVARFRGRIRLGGSLLPDVQYPLLWFTAGKRKPYREVVAPAYLILARVGERWRWRLRSKDGDFLGFGAEGNGTPGGKIAFDVVVAPGVATAWWRDFDGLPQAKTRATQEPWRGELVSQVGHSDGGGQKSDGEGDEPLPEGSILESFEIEAV